MIHQKCNVFCAISAERLYRPFFFNKRTIAGIVYLDTTQQWQKPKLHFSTRRLSWPFPQWSLFLLKMCYQEDGQDVHLKMTLLDAVAPKITRSRDFFLWGYIKDSVFIPPMLPNIADVKEHIIEMVNIINKPTLIQVWQELNYHMYVCSVSSM